MTRRLLLLILLAVGILMPASAQTGKFYSTDNGLQSSLINRIFQDSRGFIWIATEHGLSRFDGSHFVSYRHTADDSTSIKNNYVRTIYEDNRHNLLMGCINGLSLYNRENDDFREIPLLRDGKIVNAHVTQIMQLRNGEVWIATSGQGVFRMENDQSRAVYLKDIFEQVDYRHFNSLHEDRDGNVWLGAEQNGLIRYNPNTRAITLYQYPHLSENNISSIGSDSEGRLFIGTFKQGVMRFDKANDRFVPVPYTGGKPLPIYCMALRGKELLIGTDGAGLKVYNPQKDQLEDYLLNTAPIDCSNGKVHSILRDRENNLWLGLFQKGVLLTVAERNPFDYYGEKSIHYNPIGKGCVMSLKQDSKGVLWVGTDNEGIYQLDSKGQRLRHFAPDDSPTGVPAVATCLFEDSRQTLWVGCFMRGIARINPYTGRCNYLLPSLQNKSVFSIAEDKEQRLYIATLGSGFYRYDRMTGALEQFESSKDETDDPMRDELLNDWVNYLFFDRDGLLWVAHYKGISCYDPQRNTFLTCNGRNLWVTDCIGYVITEDSNGRLWAGTTNGLYSINKDTREVRHFTTKEGLPSNVICGICEDTRQQLWVSTYYGISNFNPDTEDFVNYYMGDGLQGNEFTHGAFCQGNDGRLYFGGVSGITAFQPEAISDTRRESDVWITNFYIFDRPVRKNTLSDGRPVVSGAVQDAEEFRLSYRDNTFSIAFSTLSYHSPEQIVYQYNIEELGHQWLSTEPGVNRVTYNNLPPGKYTFRVRALDHAQYSSPRTITVYIAPPWYQTWWAYTIYALLLLLLAWGITNYIMARMRHKREIMKREHAEQLNEAKLQFFINISHEIRTPMTLIINPLEKLLTHSADSRLHQTYLMMYRNAQRILRLINQLMDVRKLDKGQMFLKYRETDMVGFIGDLMQTFAPLARQKQINFTFEHEVAQLQAWVDLNNFDKVLMNILSNAFKYTPEGGEITVTLSTGTDPSNREALHHYFQIVVQDNGIGIDEDKIERIFERFYQINNDATQSNFGTGIGLHLSRSLVQLHHGILFAENRHDTSGSRFIIRLPQGADHLRADELESPDAAPIRAFHQTTPDMEAEWENEEADNRAAEKPGKAKTNLRVLVVEDEEEIGSYLKTELSAYYKVDTCRNGKEAYEQVLLHTPDLIVSDIMMPVMDGLELCRKIKQNTNVNHVPVILLTAKSGTEAAMEGMEQGADAYIVKPCNMELLKSTIANLLANRRLLRNKFSGAQQQEDKMEKITMKSSDEQLIARIMKVVNEHLDDPELSVEMLASEVGLSRVHIHRKLKELTNLSARDFIKNIRLQQAAKLLAEDKKLTISEVAYATGYTNMSHFSSSFREKYGMSPTEYMARHHVGDTPENP